MRGNSPRDDVSNFREWHAFMWIRTEENGIVVVVVVVEDEEKERKVVGVTEGRKSKREPEIKCLEREI